MTTERSDSSSDNNETPINPNKQYQNPTFGLSLWGPLVPASDCKSCLYTLTGIQGLGGLFLWWYPGRAVNPPRNIWKTRFLRTFGILAGTYTLFLTSLELVRLQLPREPWAEDAAAARKKAIDEGKKASWWFGPAGYKAIDMTEWRKRVDGTFNMGKAETERANAAKTVYSEIKSNNRTISSRILGELQNGKVFPMHEEEDQEDAKVRNVTDDEIEWDVLVPWEQLREETDILVRLMPHTRGPLEGMDGENGEDASSEGEGTGGDKKPGEMSFPVLTPSSQ